MPYVQPTYDMEQKLREFNEQGYVIFEQLFDPDVLDGARRGLPGRGRDEVPHQPAERREQTDAGSEHEQREKHIAETTHRGKLATAGGPRAAGP